MSNSLDVILRVLTIFLSGACLGSGHWVVCLALLCAWLYLPFTSEFAVQYRADLKSGRRS